MLLFLGLLETVINIVSYMNQWYETACELPTLLANDLYCSISANDLHCLLKRCGMKMHCDHYLLVRSAPVGL